MVAAAPTQTWSLADIEALAARLDSADPDEIIRFACENFGAQLAVATQFGAEGCTLLHRVSNVAKSPRFFTIDTGLLFAETYDLAAKLEAQLDIKIQRFVPAQSVGQQAAVHGPNLWERDPDLCCSLRKVSPMHDALRGMRAWMTAVRREQSTSRRAIRVVQWDSTFQLVKFAPFAHLTGREVEDYAKQHKIPLNPLRLLGYSSIGCMTCTRPVQEGEDPRAGRWWRSQKTECGLHAQPVGG